MAPAFGEVLLARVDRRRKRKRSDCNCQKSSASFGQNLCSVCVRYDNLSLNSIMTKSMTTPQRYTIIAPNLTIPLACWLFTTASFIRESIERNVAQILTIPEQQEIYVYTLALHF